MYILPLLYLKFVWFLFADMFRGQFELPPSSVTLGTCVTWLSVQVKALDAGAALQTELEKSPPVVAQVETQHIFVEDVIDQFIEEKEMQIEEGSE